jgi:hypothetical protein
LQSLLLEQPRVRNPCLSAEAFSEGGSASTLPRFVQSTELNNRNKEKIFENTKDQKIQDPLMPRIQASTIKIF